MEAGLRLVEAWVADELQPPSKTALVRAPVAIIATSLVFGGMRFTPFSC